MITKTFAPENGVKPFVIMNLELSFVNGGMVVTGVVFAVRG